MIMLIQILVYIFCIAMVVGTFVYEPSIKKKFPAFIPLLLCFTPEFISIFTKTAGIYIPKTVFFLTALGCWAVSVILAAVFMMKAKQNKVMAALKDEEE